MGDVNSAIDVSITYHHWDQAIYISNKYSIYQVARLFADYSQHLVEQQKINRAVEINVQAKYWFTAAKFVMKVYLVFLVPFGKHSFMEFNKYFIVS